jgi:Putative Ig domain
LGATAVSVVVLVPPAVAGASVKVLPTTLPNGPVGQFYSQTITASGGTAPYTFTVIKNSPPAGLTLSPDGTLSGTPPAAEMSTFTVKATDSSSTPISGTRSYTLVFGLVFSTKSLPGTNIGASYSKQIVVKGGTAPLTFTVSSGSPPPGITVSSSGLVSGSATTPGTYAFTVSAADSSSPQQTNSQAFKVKVGILGQWTLCTYTPSGGFDGIDGVTLSSGGQLQDNDGATGHWGLSSANKLTISNFVNRDYSGNWDAANNQFDGTFTGVSSGTFAMVSGPNSGPNCSQP